MSDSLTGLHALAQGLEQSAVGAWMRGGGWNYALTNMVHLAGLALLVGPALVLDLRLLGFGRTIVAANLARLTVPLAASGVVIMVLSGVALLSADAVALSANPALGWKLAAIALALLNVLVFHRRYARHLPDWDQRAPWGGRGSAALSLMLWLVVLCLGRLIAYL